MLTPTWQKRRRVIPGKQARMIFEPLKKTLENVTRNSQVIDLE